MTLWFTVSFFVLASLSAHLIPKFLSDQYNVKVLLSGVYILQKQDQEYYQRLSIEGANCLKTRPEKILRGQKPWIPTTDISKSPNVAWFFPPTKVSFYKAIPEHTSCNTRGHLLDSKHNFIHDRCTFHLKPVFYLGSIRSFSFGHFFPQN